MTPHLRVVVVGCGGMAGEWLRILKGEPGVEVVGLADIREDAARRRAAEFALDGVVVGTDAAGVMERAKPDVVCDLTVPEAHHGVTLAALARGCHVLGEKPLADSMECAREMVEAARAAGRTYAVMQNRRYDANIRRLRAFLESGAIGAVTTVNADFYIGPHFGGFRDEMDHVLLLDMAIHTFDAARLVSGADPVAVSCTEWNPANSWYRHGASATAVFEMTGGVVFNYRGSWCAEGLPTTWESDWRIIGSRGTVKWDGADGFQAEVVEEPGGFFSKTGPVPLPPAPPDARVGGHEGCIRDILRCIREGRRPETDAADNIRSLAMVFGAIESAGAGRRIQVIPES